MSVSEGDRGVFGAACCATGVECGVWPARFARSKEAHQPPAAEASSAELLWPPCYPHPCRTPTHALHAAGGARKAYSLRTRSVTLRSAWVESDGEEEAAVAGDDDDEDEDEEEEEEEEDLFSETEGEKG